MAVVTQPVYVSERDINPHVLLSKSEKEKVVEFSLPDFIMAHKIWRKLVTWSPNTMPSEWPWFGPSAFSNTYGLEMSSPPPAWGTPRHTTGKWIVGGELLQNENTVVGGLVLLPLLGLFLASFIFQLSHSVKAVFGQSRMCLSPNNSKIFNKFLFPKIDKLNKTEQNTCWNGQLVFWATSQLAAPVPSVGMRIPDLGVTCGSPSLP